MKFQVFGSHDSIDCDIMVFVDSLGNTAECRGAIREYEEVLQKSFDKKVNVNLAVIKDGFVSEVFKGTADEVNNSLYITYALHPQRNPLMIAGRQARNAGLKALRSMRAILSFISRTEHRAAVKLALTGSAVDKHAFLNKIELGAITDLGAKNTDITEFRKMSAFQMGQSYLLNSGIEVYTKAGLAESLPELNKFIFRDDDDPRVIDSFKTRWLASFNPSQIPQFENLRG